MCGAWLFRLDLCHIFTLCNNRICFISQSHKSWNEVMRGTLHKNVIEVMLTAIKRIKRHFHACRSSLQNSHRAELKASSSHHFLLSHRQNNTRTKGQKVHLKLLCSCYISVQLSDSLSASGPHALPQKTHSRNNIMYQNKSMTLKIRNNKSISWSTDSALGTTFFWHFVDQIF